MESRIWLRVKNSVYPEAFKALAEANGNEQLRVTAQTNSYSKTIKAIGGCWIFWLGKQCHKHLCIMDIPMCDSFSLEKQNTTTSTVFGKYIPHSSTLGSSFLFDFHTSFISVCSAFVRCIKSLDIYLLPCIWSAMEQQANCHASLYQHRVIRQWVNSAIPNNWRTFHYLLPVCHSVNESMQNDEFKGVRWRTALVTGVTSLHLCHWVHFLTGCYPLVWSLARVGVAYHGLKILPSITACNMSKHSTSLIHFWLRSWSAFCTMSRMC